MLDYHFLTKCYSLYLLSIWFYFYIQLLFSCVNLCCKKFVYSNRIYIFLEEARRKKRGKKKKKYMQKLLGLAMLMKAKIGLLLQLISTHFQLKFFVIAVISLILNAVRFWIEVKKNQPSKVIYYEHAQHQHHYDHDEHDHGYWGRSSNETPQELAYRAYVPKEWHQNYINLTEETRDFALKRSKEKWRKSHCRTITVTVFILELANS